MNTRFDYCLKFVSKWEGGYVNNPADRGGRTNLGVTQATLDRYNQQKGLGAQDVATLTEKKAREIYFDNYWMPARCGHLPEPLDLVVFDTAVNMGVGRASKVLQRVLGVTVDGSIGPKTLDALREEIAAGRVDDLCTEYIRERHNAYMDIVRKDETQKVFIKGWLNRLADLKTTTEVA